MSATLFNRGTGKRMCFTHNKKSAHRRLRLVAAKLELVDGLEPSTCALRVRRSTD